MKAQSNALLAIFSGVIAATLIYVYYVSPLRDRIESKLFDIRTRLSPSFVSTDAVAVVAIDEKTIAALEPAGAKDLSYDSLRRLVEAALATRAEVVAVMLPPQVFPYDDPRLEDLAAMAAADERLVLGLFDVWIAERDVEGAKLLPPALSPVLPQVAKADVRRYFRREIVRHFVIQEDGELPYLPTVIAERLRGRKLGLERFKRGAVESLSTGETEKQIEDQTMMQLNYFEPQMLRTVKGEDLVSTAASPAGARLDGRAVLIGYTAYRPFSLRDREATLVNSPWQADGTDVGGGLPVVTVQATALVNLLEDTWLVDSPPFVNVLQTLVITALTLLSWRLSVGFASLLFIGGWSLILIGHALLFSFANVYVPLADTVLISSLAMMSGALWRLRIEGRLRALQEARADSEAELAATQERFLDRFSFELANINKEVRTRLERHGELKSGADTLRTAYVRALGSCEELDDYLQGIQHFASLGGKNLHRPQLVRIDVMEVIGKVLRQFESRKQESKVEIEVEVEGGEPGKAATALADGTLVSQIVYNLVSNGLKYSPQGSALKVRVVTKSQTVAVRVEDQGPGIAREFHERIFEKFYRVKDDYVYKLKGHGLGLYLSRFFAEQIDASLVVDSESGRGAAFTLTMRGAPS